MNPRVVVIAADQLGILEHHFTAMSARILKRDRRAEYSRLSRVLKDLGLVERNVRIKGLAMGVDMDGALCAFIICEVTQRIVGEVGPEEAA